MPDPRESVFGALEDNEIIDSIYGDQSPGELIAGPIIESQLECWDWIDEEMASLD